ncbi:hypothetical protein KIH87_12755 [Paraneptunicella aestuarii]|uniref:hypothetical protein n=1 Tax=Paraneptunicella aestuarii TaxID=2831148 RepID=UPI001E5D862E|nr:hypothetical protein [Paraneptunicella aestuarii]UAA37579.1 hypothetical protein KIH87_12755 [Paraneptunicella aestuarii]
MVDRISKPAPPTPASRIRKTNKAKGTAKEAQKSDPPSQSLTERVMSKIDFKNMSSEAKIRRQMVFHTLCDILGEKAVSSPQFAELVEKIDNTLANSSLTEEQLKEVIKKKSNK